MARQRERLAVLNRVLRHNLRNDLSAIDGYVELSADQPADRDEYLDRIRGLTADLLAIGEKARHVEQLVATRQAHEPAPLSTVIDEAVDEVRAADPTCDVETEVEGEATVDGAVLGPVLRELVDNACRHGESSPPEVRVEAAVHEDAELPVTVRVADDGPGIPDHELAPLRAGTETPLEHGSGLGLWLVNWGVATLGGELAFEEREPRGTVVTIRVPAAG